MENGPDRKNEEEQSLNEKCTVNEGKLQLKNLQLKITIIKKFTIKLKHRHRRRLY